MDKSVTYAFGGKLGGSGIGRIAGHAVEGVYRSSMLHHAVTMENNLDKVPDSRIRTVPFGRVMSRIPSYVLKDVLFDITSRRQIGSPDLFHGWNNMCLRSLRRASNKGALTVVERASSHPRVQRRIVEEEYKRHGIDASIYDERHFRRALNELRECDAVFVPSQFVYDSFLAEGFDKETLKLIPFGVDADTFTPPADLGRSASDFTALFVGQISLRKGVQYLLPAWQRANIKGTLKLAGQVREDTKPIVDKFSSDPSIEFLGWVDDMAAEYRDATVFVFPSLEEGSALVSYEAMASGLPSIVTPNVGSLVSDGENGVIVEPRNVDAIASALERLATDSNERRRLGLAARETVTAYTWEKYGDKVAKAYRDLLDC